MRYLPPATAIAGEGRYPGEPGAEEGTAAALNMEDILYVLRKRRNDAVHGGLDSRHNSIAVPGTNIFGVDANRLFQLVAESDEIPNVIMVDDNEVILSHGLDVLGTVMPGAAIMGFIKPTEAVESIKDLGLCFMVSCIKVI